MANLGITNASDVVINPASRQLLANINSPTGFTIDSINPSILTLTKFETKCLLIQLGELESNTNVSMISTGVPTFGIYKANINANVYFANVATVTITNASHSDIKLGMIANTQSLSVGAFGNNTVVLQKSIGGNIIAGNFIPGCTYTISSVGSTDFTLIGANASVIGDIFVANAVGTGTGTALGTNNQIILSSNHTVSGDVVFSVGAPKYGKYQNTQWLLIQQGYLNSDGSWTGKNGVDSLEIFLSSLHIQDRIMIEFLREKYVELVKAGAIREKDSKSIVAGMLALAYQYQDITNPDLNFNRFDQNGKLILENYSIGTRANVWRETGQTLDSQKRPGHIYFNGGRYAIRTLGADVPE